MSQEILNKLIILLSVIFIFENNGGVAYLTRVARAADQSWWPGLSGPVEKSGRYQEKKKGVRSKTIYTPKKAKYSC